MFDHMTPEVRAAHETTGFPLWDGPAPGAKGNTDADIPELYPVLPASPAIPLPVILVLPGGKLT
jgi:hypothetical protein